MGLSQSALSPSPPPSSEPLPNSENEATKSAADTSLSVDITMDAKIDTKATSEVDHSPERHDDLLSQLICNMAFPTRRFVTIVVKGLDMFVKDESGSSQMVVSFFTPTQAAALHPDDGRFTRHCFAPTIINKTRDFAGPHGCVQFNYTIDVAFFSSERGPKKMDVLGLLGKYDMDLIQQVAIESTGPHWYKFLPILKKFPPNKLTRIFILRNHNFDAKSPKVVDINDIKQVVARYGGSKGMVDRYSVEKAGNDDVIELAGALPGVKSMRNIVGGVITEFDFKGLEVFDLENKRLI